MIFLAADLLYYAKLCINNKIASLGLGALLRAASLAGDLG